MCNCGDRPPPAMRQVSVTKRANSSDPYKLIMYTLGEGELCLRNTEAQEEQVEVAPKVGRLKRLGW